MYGVTAVVQCVMSATVRARAVRRSQVRQRLYNLLNGDEGLAMWCGRVLTVLIIASLLPLCFKESSPILETIEYGCVLVFIVEYLASLPHIELTGPPAHEPASGLITTQTGHSSIYLGIGSRTNDFGSINRSVLTPSMVDGHIDIRHTG